MALNQTEQKRASDWPGTLTDDNWAHRSREMQCSTCMWFVWKMIPTNTMSTKGMLGRCRRRAPTLSGFPAVFETDWCGDHKLDETKV